MNEEARLSKLNFYGLHVLLASIVLIFSVSISDQFALPKYAVLQSGSLVLFASWLYWYLSSQKSRVQHTGNAVLVAFFILVVLFSTIFSMNRTLSLVGKYHRYEGLLTQISYVILFFLSVQLLNGERALWKHIKIMSLIAVLASFYGLVQFMGFDIFNWAVATGSVAGQSLSTLGNRSFLGGFLVLALPLTLAWFFSVGGRERWLAGLASSVILIALVSAETRASWIGAVFGLVFFAFLARKKLRIKMAHFLAAASLVVVLIFLIFAVGLLQFDKMREVASRATTVSVGSGAVRLETWKAALTMIAYRPLVGTGPDAFRLLFTRFQSARYSRITPWQTISDDPHNYFLNLSSTLGLPGLLAMTALLFALLWRGTKDAFSGGSLLCSGFLAAVVSYVVHLSLSVGHLASNAWMWVIFGVLSAHLFPLQEKRKTKRKTLDVRFRGLILVLAALIALAATIFAATRYLADFYFTRGQRNIEAGWVDDGIADV